MAAFGLIFTILTICGCWRPPTWTSFYKRLLYNLYTIFVICLMFTTEMSQVIGVCLNADNSSDIYILLEQIAAFCKMLSLVMNTNGIARLMETLAQEPLKPLDDEEKEIQSKFDKELRYISLGYSYMDEISLTFYIILSLATDFRRRQLMFTAWLPFDNTPSYLFYLSYAHQISALILACLLHISLDLLICGFLIQICSQIKILENRLTKITNERSTIMKLCARHHQSIYEFAANVNDIFQFIVFVQFSISTSVVCFTLYLLTKVSLVSFDFIKTSFYMVTMLIQVFLYCWFGNLVTLKSQDIYNQIFAINWPDLNINIRKSLLIIMNRTVMPIIFLPLNIIPMNLQTFVSILKTSYSAYNLLQQTQE